jgi:hypothetical protein
MGQQPSVLMVKWCNGGEVESYMVHSHRNYKVETPRSASDED